VARALVWLGSSLEDLRGFPVDSRRSAGYQLRRVQEGLEPNDWKAIPTVGTGVREIRLHTGTEHRVFYIARFSEAVYVLHAFEKKAQKTPKRDLDVGRRRYQDLVEARRKVGHGKK
jgi:phage-related protein